MGTAKDTFNKHRAVIYISVTTIIVVVLAYAFRSVVLPFVVGLFLAYVLKPFVSWLEKRLPRRMKNTRTRRILTIFIIFIILLVLIALLLYSMITAVAGALVTLADNATELINDAFDWLGKVAGGLRFVLPPEIWQQLQSVVQDIATAVLNAVRVVFVRGISSIPGTVNTIVGFAALPVFLYYLLKDWEKLGKGFYSLLPTTMVTPTKEIIAIIELVLARYIRAQILLGIVVGILAFIGLAILRVPFAPALASLAAVTELIPVLGPWIGGTVAVVVALAMSPEKAIWVVLLFALIQLLENLVLVPRIHGAYLRIHPAVVLVLLILGAFIAGIWGMIIAVPLAATAVEIYKYARRNDTES